MKKPKDIHNEDDKGRTHGYQEWYFSDGGLIRKGCYRHGEPIRYQIRNYNKFDKVRLCGYAVINIFSKEYIIL